MTLFSIMEEISFGDMRLVKISSEEEPTQELNLNAHTVSPKEVVLDPVELVEIAPQDREQLPIHESGTKQQSIMPVTVEQDGHEQQPAHKITLEQQATLPMVFEQPNVHRSSLEAQKVADQKTQELGALFPTEKKRGRRSYKSLLWWVPLLMFVVLFIIVLSGGSTIEAWISHHVVRNQPLTPIMPIIHPQPTPTQPSSIDSTATLFMNAMLRKDWVSMWLMLSPDAQQQWQGVKDFIHFEQAKFGSLQLTSYIKSPSQMHNTWLDPDTTQMYSNVEVLHISLKVSAPPGLLSAPSNITLNKGLFQNTLFAMEYSQFKWRILLAGPVDPEAPILVPFSLPTTKLLVPIFMYHHVSNQPVSNYLDYGLTVTTTNFNTQLDWLQRQGYRSISQTELFDALYYGKALPAHPMILTFDDGYEDVYMNALPALLAHHYRGVFYIITGMIGGNYMTWPQVRKLAQDGMQVSSHTIHHVNIGQPPTWTTTQKELLASKQTLEAQLKQPVQFFCYPTGEPFHHDPVYEQQIVLADLFKDGYVAATLDPFSFDSVIQNAQTPYQLPRIRVSGVESMQLFTSILNSTLSIDAFRIVNGYAF